jgi:hypothetical protein
MTPNLGPVSGPVQTSGQPHDLFGRGLAVALQVVIAALVVVTTILYLGVEPFRWVDLLDLLGFMVWVLAFSIVGVLIVFHRPGNPISWLCLGYSLVWASYLVIEAALTYENAHPGTIADPALLAALGYPLWVPGVGLVAVLLLIFPDGHLLSPAWRPVAWALGITMSVLFVTSFFLPGEIQETGYVNPIGIEAMAPWKEGAPAYTLVLLLVACLIASAISLALRYRRAESIERLQLKWLVAAALASAAGYVLLFVWNFPVQLLWVTIPIAIGLSMHRYRLYDIDRVISRTFTYAVLVAVLALVYGAAVFLLGSLPQVESDLAVALSTLTAAALFNPLRRRVQAAVDRRFNRTRYDLDRVTEGFARSLQDTIDTEQITKRWVGVVTDAVEPGAIGVWVR